MTGKEHFCLTALLDSLGLGEFRTGLVGTGKASVSLRDLRGLDDKGGRVNGGKVRQLANYVSRKIGTPGTRRGQLITQAQVKF